MFGPVTCVWPLRMLMFLKYISLKTKRSRVSFGAMLILRRRLLQFLPLNNYQALP